MLQSAGDSIKPRKAERGEAVKGGPPPLPRLIVRRQRSRGTRGENDFKGSFKMGPVNEKFHGNECVWRGRTLHACMD